MTESDVLALENLAGETRRAAVAAEAMAKELPKTFKALATRITALEKRVAKLEGKKTAKKKVPK